MRSKYKGEKIKGDVQDLPTRETEEEYLADEKVLAVGGESMRYEIPREEVQNFCRPFWLFNSNMRKRGINLTWEYGVKVYRRSGGLPDVVYVRKKPKNGNE